MAKNVLLALSFIGAIVLQPGSQVPAALLAAVGEPPLVFIGLLAEAAVPAGLEIKQPERFRPASKAYDIDRDSTTSVAELIKVFNLSNRDYRAESMADVVVIRPAERKAAYLDSSAPPGWISGRGLMSMTEKLFAPLHPTLAISGGRPGSLLSPMGMEIDRGENVQLTVDATRRRVIDVLNEIAKQAPGHPWLVTTDDPAAKIVRFGFMHRHGTTTEQPLP